MSDDVSQAVERAELLEHADTIVELLIFTRLEAAARAIDPARWIAAEALAQQLDDETLRLHGYAEQLAVVLSQPAVLIAAVRTVYERLLRVP